MPSPQTDAPPTNFTGSQAGSGRNPHLVTPAIPDGVKPTSFLSLSRTKTSIKGSFVIDPQIPIPDHLLVPRTSEEPASPPQNVFLHTSNGNIEVDLFVIGASQQGQRVRLAAESSNGSITVRLHAPGASRPSISLNAQSSHGSITIHVPRNFCGPLTVQTQHGTVRFSDTVSANLTTFSETNSTIKCFVGDLSGSDWMVRSGMWSGDEIHIESSRGSIRFKYDDEPPAPGDSRSIRRGTTAYFARLLGI
ncbi:hypothetical protein C8R43DRAFT_1168110 [Mycena crocata]|nr:hypothetical protein C8R43DRAFT_1168110 [Mycena crocata]